MDLGEQTNKLKDAYEKDAYDEAIAIADEILRHDPRHPEATRYRALALTFAERHEEAIVAYGVALEAWKGGMGAAPQLHFNRACEFARMSHDSEALQDLRLACDADSSFRAEARADPYFEKLWNDPEFLRITGPSENAADSAYVLEISCVPGGARRNDYYSFGLWSPIREQLSEEFLAAEPEVLRMNLSLAICYGERLAVRVVNNGRMSRMIDLHPFISVKWAKSSWVPLSDSPALEPLRKELLEKDEREYEGDPDEDELELRCRIDWETLERELPQLTGRRLGPGQVLEVLEAEGLRLPYGYDDRA